MLLTLGSGASMLLFATLAITGCGNDRTPPPPEPIAPPPAPPVLAESPRNSDARVAILQMRFSPQLAVATRDHLILVERQNLDGPGPMWRVDIVRYTTAGGDRVVLAAFDETTIRALEADAQHLYFIRNSSESDDRVLTRVAIHGGPVEVLATFTGKTDGIALIDGGVLVGIWEADMKRHGIWEVRPGSKPIRVDQSKHDDYVFVDEYDHLAADARFAYWVVPDGGFAELRRIPRPFVGDHSYSRREAIRLRTLCTTRDFVHVHAGTEVFSNPKNFKGRATAASPTDSANDLDVWRDRVLSLACEGTSFVVSVAGPGFVTTPTGAVVYYDSTASEPVVVTTDVRPGEVVMNEDHIFVHDEKSRAMLRYPRPRPPTSAP